MTRHFLSSLLLVAFLAQGWAQAGMTMSSSSVNLQQCDMHMDDGEECACCPEGALAGGGCEAMCGALFAAAQFVDDSIVASGQISTRLVVLTRASPDYIPLNPPPIA